MATLRRVHRPVCDLHCRHRRCCDTIRRSRHHLRIQCYRPGRPSDPHRGPWAAVAIQGAESGRAATLYRVDGVLRARVVDDVTQARPDHGRIPGALYCCTSVRMEFAVLSGWKLVSQPVLLAAAFCVWRLARAQRSKGTALNSQVKDPDLFRDRLPDFRSRRDAGYSMRSTLTTKRISPHIASCISSSWCSW